MNLNEAMSRIAHLEAENAGLRTQIMTMRLQVGISTVPPVADPTEDGGWVAMMSALLDVPPEEFAASMREERARLDGEVTGIVTSVKRDLGLPS